MLISLVQITGLSRAQVTRLISAQCQTGRVLAVAYEPTKFVTRHTVLSGTATQRILEREYGEYNQGLTRAGSHLRGAPVPAAQLRGLSKTQHQYIN
jgi:hypothetical protein